ncbi:MAG: phosphoglycerate kinase [Rickettsiales bacterium]|jgi:phosphoglycerate kinase|nr:phosphoglycerate kinase [Rickettsiales bacterium]
MKIHTINELGDIRGKYVLLRDDFNVQITDGKIIDAFRIEQSMPTIKFLQQGGARVAICAHLGRPNGVRDEKYTLRPVADYLKIPLIDDCLDKDFLPKMKDGDVVLLENLRFYEGEEENDEKFAKKLAAGFDIFVNDAFAVSHRAHASTTGVAKILPSYAGNLLTDEIRSLTQVMQNPPRPLMAIVGGGKVGTKLDLLRSLVSRCDVVCMGGGIGTSFVLATGKYDWTDELYKDEYKNSVNEIIKIANENNCKIVVPVDKGVGPEFSPKSTRTNKKLNDILPNDVIMDDGPESVENYKLAMRDAKCVIWNGTMGMAEWGDVWGASTFSLARYLGQRTRAGDLMSVVGGGDAVAATEYTNTKNDMTYVSTGGGAFLEFIEGRTLPGIAVLEK